MIMIIIIMNFSYQGSAQKKKQHDSNEVNIVYTFFIFNALFDV